MIKLPSDYLAESKSDKTNTFHRYGNFYDMLITSLYYMNHHAPLKALEIGVSRFGEGSGHAFCKMPQVAQFVGIDTEPLAIPFNDKGVFLQGDAYADAMLDRVAEYAPFHLLIDDGHHSQPSWDYFINHYMQFIATPGALVVEDIYRTERIACKDMIFVKHVGSGNGGRIGYVPKFNLEG